MDTKRRAQPSRKGRKAWRKNIDVDDINSALEAKREREVLHGTDDTEADFVIDTDAATTTAKPTKVLKTTEILTNKSKVPAITTRKVKNKVGKQRTDRLMALAGRLLTKSALRARTDADGILRTAGHDVWGAEPEPEAPLPEEYQKSAFVEYTAPKRAPSTLKHKPVALRTASAAEAIVHEGKSYNPSLDLWKDLIKHEFGVESNHEVKRQAMIEHQERIQYLIETLEDNEVQSGDEVNNEEEAEESNEDDKYKLSLNKRTELKIKTKTKRNREAKHKQRVELQAKLKELKKQIHDLEKLDHIEEEVEAKLAEPKVSRARLFGRHGKHDVTFKPIEVKLSDELTNNLRSLKPEGNILYDQMHKLQSTGKVESRVPVSKKRKYKQKFTEKWSYKDFK